jgi:poly-gamma-glutamate capsule biosynthesis protein CapA/YwtB (metallophosphatase superfamily)
MRKSCKISRSYYQFFVPVGLFLAWFIVFSSCSKTQQQRVNDKILNEKSEVKQDDKVKDDDTLYSVLGVGDIMMGTNYPGTASLPPDDGKYLFDDVKDIIQSADISFGNLEGTLLNSGGTPKKGKNDSSRVISFRMPEHYASYLKDAGFHVVSVANNHSCDMGDEGRESTMKTLDKYEIKYAGYIICPTTIIVKNGVRFGFTAFAPNNGTNNLNDIDEASKIVSELKKKCDIVIVSFHGGAEGTGCQHVTGRREIFLGEDRGNVLEFAHAMVDAGADVIFGQGPHVTRAIELYKDRLIAYSLGNFCTYGKFGLSGALGLAPILKLYIDKQGRFVQGRIFPTKQIKRGGPVMDDDYRIVSIMQTLTKQDFPHNTLSIEDEGKIVIKE